jgi:hypothetical protein
MGDTPMDKCCGRLTGMCGTCERRPTIVRDNKHYCWQHDPQEAVEAYEAREADGRWSKTTHE